MASVFPAVNSKEGVSNMPTEELMLPELEVNVAVLPVTSLTNSGAAFALTLNKVSIKSANNDLGNRFSIIVRICLV